MSLLNTASVWQNDHESSGSATTKKRMPTMNRKPSRPKPYVNEYGPEEYQKEDNTSLLGNVIPAGTGGSIMEDQRRNNERNEKVYAMLDQLNQVNADNDGNRLADFTPLAPPQVQQKKPLFAPAGSNLQPPMSNSLYSNPSSSSKSGETTVNLRHISPDDSNVSKFSNYRYAYDTNKIPGTNGVPAPYYAKMGIGKPNDDRLMEKINYMIHLLEEQQLEKTNNVMEEFLLYTFLGVFMIYIVDGFSRAGKYIR